MPDNLVVYADHKFHPEKEGAAVTTVGTYDGVHLGHQEILRRMQVAGADQVRTVVTFEPHPQTVMLKRPGVMPSICNTSEKVRLLKNCGVDRVFVLYFTEELQQVSAEQFLKTILLDELKSTKLVVGYNHAFGKDRQGNSDFLKKAQQKYGYGLEIVGPHMVGKEAVSSTKVRLALGQGEVDLAHQYLGRPYYLEGVVVPGRGIGKELSFPTANLSLVHQEKLIPKIGVYAVAAGVDGRHYPGMLNIGTRPTFGEGEVTIEVHLINFAGELYGKTISLVFLTRLRDEQRFQTTEQLVEQIKQDRSQSMNVYDAWPEEVLVNELFQK